MGQTLRAWVQCALGARGSARVCGGAERVDRSLMKNKRPAPELRAYRSAREHCGGSGEDTGGSGGAEDGRSHGTGTVLREDWSARAEDLDLGLERDHDWIRWTMESRSGAHDGVGGGAGDTRGEGSARLKTWPRNSLCVPSAADRTKNTPFTENTAEDRSREVDYPPFPGIIPQLIVTRDPSPGRGEAGCESPCSDSGCGGSPVPYFSLRKLSSSSSAGLSSASSFEESEDDVTSSDAESAGLSPRRSGPFGTPEEVAGVSLGWGEGVITAASVQGPQRTTIYLPLSQPATVPSTSGLIIK